MPQPDVQIDIGLPPATARFWVHSQVIGQYSGYLRSAVAALASTSPYNHPTDKPILLSNVNLEQFQPLLRYMYSGFLDLTMDNIFGVLLATHILHMPHALEICRSYLSRMQAHGLIPSEQEPRPELVTLMPNKPVVIKPIPNKAKQLDATISSPSAPHVLHQSSGSTFQSLYLSKPTEPPAIDLGPAVQNKCNNSAKLHKDSEEKRDTLNRTTPPILDIASCDGPVRFRRVVNKYYNTQKDLSVGQTEDRKTSDRIQQLTGSSFHQQMARDITERRLYDETQQTLNSQDTDHNSSNPGLYTCTICKHDFKSEYCFLKHSNRHLIPLECDAPDNVENLTPRVKVNWKRKPNCLLAKSSNREVIRPLDMNVQYYPCKTCGSKFPSYYFVHKHRKMCHPQGDGEQLEPDGDSDPEETTGNSNAQ